MTSSKTNFVSQNEELLSRRKQAADQAMLGLPKGYEYTIPYYINDKSDIIKTNKSKLSFSNHSQKFKRSYFNLKKDLLGEPKPINTNNNFIETDKIKTARNSHSNKLKYKIKSLYNKFQIAPIKNKFSSDNNIHVDQELLDCLLSEEDLVNKYKNIKHHSINLSGIQKINNYIFYSSRDSKKKIEEENNKHKTFNKKLHIQKIISNNFEINGNNNTKITEIKETKKLNTNNNKINIDNKIKIENNKIEINKNFDNQKFDDPNNKKEYIYTYEKNDKTFKNPNNPCHIISINFCPNNFDKKNSVQQNNISPITSEPNINENKIDNIQTIQNNSIKFDNKESITLEDQKSSINNINNINNYDNNNPINTGINKITKNELISINGKIEEESLNKMNIQKNNFNKNSFNKLGNSNNEIKSKDKNNNNKCLISSVQINNSISKIQKNNYDDVSYDLRNSDFEIFESNQINNNKLMNFNNKLFDNKNNNFNSGINKQDFCKENSNTFRLNKISNNYFANNKYTIEKSTHAQEMLNEIVKNNTNKILKTEDTKYFTFRVGENFNVNKKIDDTIKHFTTTFTKNKVPDIRLISDNNGKEEIKIFDENEYKKIIRGDEKRKSKNFMEYFNNFEYGKKKKIGNYTFNDKTDLNFKNIHGNRSSSLSNKRKYYGIKTMWINNNNKIMPPNDLYYLNDLYKI